jgi:large subunit ribosomal protein L22
VETTTKKRITNKKKRREKRKEAEAANKENPVVVARAKYVKAPPQKVRLIADAIRGKSTEEALHILRFIPKKAARLMEKVVESAIANAENNFQLDTGELFVFKAYVDGGPIVRRFRARAMGRATPIRRRTSHITVALKERGEKK